tara:strand:- start:305 stop:607 length:303 start_codon:yes stop_codon:yes gene_type:complete
MINKKNRFEPKNIKNALIDFIGNGNLKKGLDNIKAKEAWRKCLGSNISSYTSKVNLRGTILIVNISSAPLKEELNYENKKILNLINTELGEDLISKIIIR